MRLGVTEQELQDTLVATVFAGCRNKSEFLALCIVANEYQLNPLIKEIYAFPAKGGGVVPMVSVDGWISLMNRHEQFDSIEFEYHVNGKDEVEAIEAVIYRKDKERPTKIIEYMDECERNTDPWRKSPKRMLRHRALIQGVRVAFGFSGISAPDDEHLVEGDYQVVPSLPDGAGFTGDTVEQRDPTPSPTPTPAATKPASAAKTETPGAAEQKTATIDQGDPSASEEQSEQDKECDLLIADFEESKNAEELGTTRNAWLDKQDRNYFDEDQNADIEDAFNVACERLGIDPNTGQLLNPPETPAPSPTPSPAPTPTPVPAASEPDYLPKVRALREKLARAKTVRAVDTMDMNEWCGPLRDQVETADSRLARSVDNDIAARKRELQAPK